MEPKRLGTGVGFLVGLSTALLAILTGEELLNPFYFLFVFMTSSFGSSLNLDFLVYWTSDSSFPHPTMWAYLIGFVPTLLLYSLVGLIIGWLYKKIKNLTDHPKGPWPF